MTVALSLAGVLTGWVVLRSVLVFAVQQIDRKVEGELDV